jgi:hypothetical protein
MNYSLLTIPGRVVDPFELCETFNKAMIDRVYTFSLVLFLGLLFYVAVLPFLQGLLKEGNFKSWVIYLSKIFLIALMMVASVVFMILRGGL